MKRIRPLRRSWPSKRPDRNATWMRQQRVPERFQAIISPEKSGATTSTSFGCLRIAIKKLPAARRVEYRVEPVVLDELPPRILNAGAPVARRVQDSVS